MKRIVQYLYSCGLRKI